MIESSSVQEIPCLHEGRGDEYAEIPGFIRACFLGGFPGAISSSDLHYSVLLDWRSSHT